MKKVSDVQFSELKIGDSVQSTNGIIGEIIKLINGGDKIIDSDCDRYDTITIRWATGDYSHLHHAEAYKLKLLEQEKEELLSFLSGDSLSFDSMQSRWQ